MDSCDKGTPSFPGCPPEVTPTPEFMPTAAIKREHPSFDDEDERDDGLDVSPWQYLVKTALCRTSDKENNHVLGALLFEVSNVLKQFKGLADKALTLQPGGGVCLEPYPMIRAALCIELQCEMCVAGDMCLDKLLEEDAMGVVNPDVMMDSDDDEMPFEPEINMDYAPSVKTEPGLVDTPQQNMTYGQMVCQAILESEEGKLTLDGLQREIRNKVTLKVTAETLKTHIRRVLRTSGDFVHLPGPAAFGLKGSGYYWAVHPRVLGQLSQALLLKNYTLKLNSKPGQDFIQLTSDDRLMMTQVDFSTIQINEEKRSKQTVWHPDFPVDQSTFAKMRQGQAPTVCPKCDYEPNMAKAGFIFGHLARNRHFDNVTRCP